MTDRDLLRLAAKAAGYWDANFNCVADLPHLAWNPLTDDGDALRLAVKLHIDVTQFRIHGGVRADDNYWPLAFEEYGSDPYAATRRAIVRAAASRGEHEIHPSLTRESGRPAQGVDL